MPKLLLVLFAIAGLGDARCQADIEVELFSGQPLGIGRVKVDLPSVADGAPAVDQSFTITDPAGRVLYPAQEKKRARKVLNNLLGLKLPEKLTYYFWFTGDTPLELDIYAPHHVRVTAQPRFDQREYQKTLEDWWKQYIAMYTKVYQEAEYPIGVQTYLTAMWSARLSQPMPKLEGFLIREHEQGGTATGKLIADEAYRASVLRDLMLGAADDPSATQPLPEHAVPVATAAPPALGGEIAIEPIASYVPEECFYIRFGTFTNYLWFRDFIGRWRGDLGNMLIQRSIRRSSTDAISKRLALKESKVAEILGPQVIEDIAIVGLDPYFADGAAVGVLFQAKNSFLLGTSLSQQRSAAAKEVSGATNEQVTIAGQKVSLLSSPDGSLRSYYVTADNYHFVCSSAALVERFLAAAKGERPLAAATDFQVARMRYPASDDNRAFVHVSSAFLTNLTSPAYRIELDRRLRSLQAERATRLAYLAAEQEGLPHETIDDLAAGAFVPRDIGQRADGAQWLTDNQGRTYESVRGYRGNWLPMADNLPTTCTAGERARYEQFAAQVTSEVASLVPLSVAVAGSEPAPGVERIAIDVHLQRYSVSNLASFAKKLGDPSPARLAPIAGDVAAAEVVLTGMMGSNEPLHLFAGLRDGPVPLVVERGSLELATSIMDGIEGYIGSYPKPQFLERMLPVRMSPYDSQGYSRGVGLFDLWFRRTDDFLLISFKQNVLFEVGNQLAMVPAERPAQAWVMLRDLVGTKYEQVVTSYAYARTRDTSASGSRFMNSLLEQLHVAPPAAHELANELVGGEFICPLGGEYQLMATPAGREVWASTAAAPNNLFLLTEIPPGYQFPLLTWFRGMTAELLRDEDTLTLSMLVDISKADFAGEIVPPPPPGN
ncbi:hypothetical protein [Aeoliella mucimassa]|uniref:hypothetical protein n=1 Tax=Aeoliella mucimassa TaxID=2527972 RepID=UPI0011A3C8B3|nr:hypothetical protein [Aeoliella mucimassa]